MKNSVEQLNELWKKHDVRDALEYLNGNPSPNGHTYWSEDLAKRVISRNVPEGEDPLEWSTRP